MGKGPGAGPGKPTVMTDETLLILKECFLMGCSDAEACLKAEVGTSTLYKYQDEHPEYVEKKFLWKKNATYIARKTVFNELPLNPDMAMKYLERKEKAEFSTASKIEQETTLKNADGESFKVEATNLTPEEIDKHLQDYFQK